MLFVRRYAGLVDASVLLRKTDLGEILAFNGAAGAIYGKTPNVLMDTRVRNYCQYGQCKTEEP